MPIPNLFNFATSELSQDAVLAYILAWADSEHSQDDRHKLGRALIQSLANTSLAGRNNLKGENKLSEISGLPDFGKVVIYRQYDKIDIVCFLDPIYGNEENPSEVTGAAAAILIEDKTFTSEHNDQLNRYLGFITDRSFIDLDKIYPVFYKTGLQANYNAELQAGFAKFSRGDMVKVFDGHDLTIKSDTILSQYKNHLKNLTAKYDQGRSKVPSGSVQQDWFAWQGFVDSLAQLMPRANPHWQYVPNAQGGFMGMWWSFHDLEMANSNSKEEKTLFEGVQIYLQLEQNTLTIRAGRWGKDADPISSNMRYAIVNHVREFLTGKPTFINSWALKRSGRSGRSCRLFNIYEKGKKFHKDEEAYTFEGGTPIGDVEAVLTEITSVFGGAHKSFAVKL